MKTIEEKQVNVHYDCVSNSYYHSITNHHKDGFTGRIRGTTYEDGYDVDNFNVFNGTQEECENWVKEHKNELSKYA